MIELPISQLPMIEEQEATGEVAQVFESILKDEEGPRSLEARSWMLAGTGDVFCLPDMGGGSRCELTVAGGRGAHPLP